MFWNKKKKRRNKNEETEKAWRKIVFEQRLAKAFAYLALICFLFILVMTLVRMHTG